jgi:hypothetical protein
LVFADTDLQQVNVYVDGVLKSTMQYNGRGSREDSPGEFIPLWTAAWTATDYDDGKPHQLRIMATDMLGRTGEDKVVFRVDGEREVLEAGWGGRIIQSNFESLVSL